MDKLKRTKEMFDVLISEIERLKKESAKENTKLRSIKDLKGKYKDSLSSSNTFSKNKK